MRVQNRRRILALILPVSLTALFLAWKNPTRSAPIQKHNVALAQLPLSFEVNRGQAAADAKFVARGGGGYALLLTNRGEPVLAFHDRPAPTHAERQWQVSRAEELREIAEPVILRLGFHGSNSAPEVQGEQRLPGHSNYLIGNDPGKWLTSIPHYARVRYLEVYPGVDVLYYTKDQQLEYDFIVRPGTNPDSIRLATQGALEIEQSEGSLVLKTAAGSAVLQKPVAYQEGPDGEREVACNYVLDEGEVRFALGDYDRSQELRIDPVLSYSTTLDALMKAIAVDASGNTYLAGSTASANFPTTPGAFQHTPAGDADALVAKLDPTGSTLLFATYLGGSGYDLADAIALDSSGNVIVAGGTHSTNLPANHAFQLVLLGNEDAFLSKLSPDGTQLLYSTYLGGLGFDSATGVALDSSGRVFVTGITDSSNFPTSAGALQAAYGGGDGDAFIAKLDTTQSGTASRLFSTYLGGSGEDAASAIAVDAGGSAFVTGMTRSANFPTANAFQSGCASCTTPEFEFDAFVGKLNADGTALVYSTFLGGHARDIGRDVSVDAIGNAYVAGQTASLNFPVTMGAFQTSEHGGGDAFVTKLNAAGSALVYSTYIGGNDFDVATGIAVDGAANAYLSGLSLSADFPTVKPLQGFSGGACDVNGFGLFPCSDSIVTQLNVSGSAIIFSTYLGGGTHDLAARIVVDAAGNAYLAGTEDGTSMYTLGPLRAPEISGIGFVAKISPANAGTEPTAITLTSSPNPSGQGKSVNFTATVTPPGATGVVTFRDGGTLIGSSPVSANGTATHSNTSLSGGSHSITAEYWGDGNFAASTSAVLAHVVTSISLVSGQTSATVSKGGSVAFPFTVSQSGALTSAISFSCSGLPVGWSCGFSPTTVQVGSAPTQVMLTVQTAGSTAQSLLRVPIESPRLPKNFWLCAFAMFVLALHISLRRRKQIYVRAAIGLGFAALLLLTAGCGSGSNSDPDSGGTPEPVTVNFTVNATSDSTTSSTSLTITAR